MKHVVSESLMISQSLSLWIIQNREKDIRLLNTVVYLSLFLQNNNNKLFTFIFVKDPSSC